MSKWKRELKGSFDDCQSYLHSQFDTFVSVNVIRYLLTLMIICIDALLI
mgnify:CR=1 FL=1